MACPTCDHTMHCLAPSDNGTTVYWCPRCGTAKLQKKHASGLPTVDTPSLPGRVRAFLKLLGDGNGAPVNDAAVCFQALRQEAWRIGLYESTIPEAERLP